MKFKNIYKMSKSERSGHNTNIGAESREKGNENNLSLDTDSSVSTDCLIITEERISTGGLRLGIINDQLGEIREECVMFPGLPPTTGDHHMRQGLLCMFSQFPGGDLRRGISSFLCEDH